MWKISVIISSVMLVGGFISTVDAASWVNTDGNLVADGDVVQNTGLVGPGNISITVGNGDSANFNALGVGVDYLGFETSAYISIFGDLWHNAGIISDGSGGFGMLGDHSFMTAPVIDVGGGIVVGDGINSYSLSMSADNINAGAITTNTGAKLIINPLHYAVAPEMNISGNAMFADGVYMGGPAIGAESLHINAFAASDYYTVNADNIIIDGNAYADVGNLVLNSVNNIVVTGDSSGNMRMAADDIFIGGNLGTGVNLSAANIHIDGDVAGGVVFRMNDTDASGFHTSFTRSDITIGGKYYFDDNSFLQLVLNNDIANSDGNSTYDPFSDMALIQVGGFDATGVTRAPNIHDPLSTPNIEIMVDGIAWGVRRINLMESATVIKESDLGALNLAGIWFYDALRQTRFFQEAGITIADDGLNLYLVISTLRSLSEMVDRVPEYAGPTVNDMNMALAIDDLIRARLQDDFRDQYSGLLRVLFPEGDIYNKMMVNGGIYDDALTVMTADLMGFETDATYIRAMNYVRGFSLDDVGELSRSMSMSGRVIRYAVGDHLLDDFIWQRYLNRGVFWATAAYIDADADSRVWSFVGGADWQFGRDFIAGATMGYNRIDLGAASGSTFNFGLYGMYSILDALRAYGVLNLTMHSMNLDSDGLLVGHLRADAHATDTTAELGIMHRIFNTYASGRAYANFGMLGGYKVRKKTSDGMDFIEARQNAAFALTPGYEVSVGKDIYIWALSFIRPSLKFGIEYDLAARSNDLRFRFPEGAIWRDWQGDSVGPRLWWRYGAGLEFAMSDGASLNFGYEIMRNGHWTIDQFKLNGSIRF